MLSYEQTLKLFGVWLADTTAVTWVEDIREKHIRAYIVELQERGTNRFFIDMQHSFVYCLPQG